MSATIILVFFTIYCGSECGCRGEIIPKPILSRLLHSYLVRRISDYRLYLYRWIFGRKLDGYHSSHIDDFALILTPLFIFLSLGDVSQFTGVLHQAEIAANKDFTDLFSSTTPLGLLSLAAWGLGYFGQPHILARFMAAYSVKSLIKARRISMTWMVICLAGAIGIGFFGIPYFFANPMWLAW